MTRGAYHFFTLCSSGAAQAANLLRTMPDDPSALAFAAGFHQRQELVTQVFQELTRVLPS
ncbi:MAG: hypothetical protein NVSMB32_18690 [Actinomycetota bacterium]